MKYRLVSNRRLAEQGRKWHLDRYIRSRFIPLNWGSTSKLSYNIVADVLEATIGAVAYHRPHRLYEETLRTAGLFCGDNQEQTNTVIAAHVRGYKPQSIYKYLDDTPLTDKEMSFVTTLEKAQK